MNSAISISDMIQEGFYPNATLHELIAERDHYRQQSEILSRVNELHIRLSGVVDLAGMVEAFSVWLMPMLPHKLIAYNNPAQGKRYMYCSSHGPDKSSVVRVAEKIFARSAMLGELRKYRMHEGNAYVNTWEMPGGSDKAQLLVIRIERGLSEMCEQLVRQGIGIFADSIQRGIEYEDLYVQARRDSLTGLANRRVFEERITPLLETARRYARPISIISMDLDRFKEINDSFGHAEGDRVLQQVAQVFSGLVRGSDLLIRMGGDEFLLLLPDTDGKAARSLATRLCVAIDALGIVSPKGNRLGVSAGVVQWQAEMAIEEWMDRADGALYGAKKKGRGGVWAV